MADVFISYSRKDKEFVQVLHQALAESQYDAWIDWEDIPPTADWWAEIEAGIEGADAFLFVISPDSVVSRVCNREIEHAVANHKRMIPIVRRDGFDSAEISRDLSRHNWLYFRPEDEFREAFSALVKALDTDLDHVKNHTHLLVRSQEWLHKDQNPDLLLRGSQLDATLAWITTSADKEPRLTPLQREYVAASSTVERDQQAVEIQRQQKELRRQRIWLGLVGAAFLIASGLGVLAFNQFRVAEARRKEVEYSQIETLATSAEAFLETNQGLDGLVYGLRAARKLAEMENVPLKTEFRVIAALQQALHTTPERNRLVGHTNEIWYTSLSPDGQLIASASADNTTKLWSINGTELATFRGHTSQVTWVAISPDNHLVVTGSEDKTVRLWNAKGELLKTLTDHNGGVRSVTFTPDGQQIVSASRDGTVKFFTLDGRIVKTLNAHAEVCNATFSPNGEFLLTFSCTNEIKLWTPAGKPIRTFTADAQDITRVVFSPDNQRFATSAWYGEITLWTMTGQMIKTMEAHTDSIWGLAFSADGETLYSAGEEGTFKSWTADGKLINAVDGFVPAIDSINASADGEIMILGDRGGAVRIWKLKQQSFKHQGLVWNLSFSPDSQSLLIGSNDGILKLWTVDGTPLKTLQQYGYPIVWTSFDAGGESIRVATSNGTAQQLTLDGQEVQTWPSELSGSTLVSFSHDGKILARGDTTGLLKIELTSGKKIASLQAHDKQIEFIVFSPDSTKLASISHDKVIKIWSVDGKLVATLSGHQGDARNIVFSPDGQKLASSGTERTIKIWSIDGKEITSLNGHRASIHALAFSPDGKILASGGADKTIKLWTVDGQELVNLKGQENDIRKLSFNSEGNLLASADVSGKTILWDLSFENLLIQTCHELRNYLQNSPTLDASDRGLCQDVEPDWLAEGEELAKRNDIPAAVEKFKVALEKQPNLEFDPSLKAKQIAAAIPLAEAERYVAKQDMAAAIKAYEKALSIYSELGFDARTQARQEIARSMIQEAYYLALEGNRSADDVEQAIDLLDMAKNLDKTVVGQASYLNSLCWVGALYGYATRIVETCEQAVVLAPLDPNIRDSRGLARALTGDINGAIADFQYFVDKAYVEDEKQRRQRWIVALKAGQNPFTPEELESLR
jgi:WD40 repeat protein